MENQTAYIDQLVRSILQVSCGTLAHLTGKTLYVELMQIEQDWIQYAINANKKYSNWMESWNDYKESLQTAI